MLSIVTVITAFAIAGGLAANALVVMSLVGFAVGGQGSHVSMSRRLPEDSDINLLRQLFIVGAVIGCMFAGISRFADGFFVAPTVIARFAVGLVVAFKRYLRRCDCWQPKCPPAGDDPASRWLPGHRCNVLRMISADRYVRDVVVIGKWRDLVVFRPIIPRRRQLFDDFGTSRRQVILFDPINVHVIQFP